MENIRQVAVQRFNALNPEKRIQQKRQRVTKFGVNVNTYVRPEFMDALKVKANELGYPSFAAYIRRLLIEGNKRTYQYKDPYDV